MVPIDGFMSPGSNTRMKWHADGKLHGEKVRNPTSSSDLIGAKLEEHQNCRIQRCSACGHKTECNEAIQDWPGLPAGVKFDPTDQELLEHLEGKVGLNNSKPHPLIDEFIPTLEGEDGICYTHPEKLPGITRDGLIRHFFHRPSKAYTTGTRKRRKIQTECDVHGGETRWHKTGKTRPVLINGQQKGCKKILVLYTNFGKHRKPEKTNWVMHQYHLGSQEDEKEGELVVSKVFYQTQPRQCNWEKPTGSRDAIVNSKSAKSATHKLTENRTNRAAPDAISNAPDRHYNYDLQHQVKAAYFPLIQTTESNDHGIPNGSDTRENKGSESCQCTPPPSDVENNGLHLNNSNKGEEWPGESRQPISQGDRGLVNLDENITRHLLCNETIQVGVLSNPKFASYGSQDLDKLAADLGLTLDDDHHNNNYQRHKLLELTPAHKTALLDDIFMDTPPEVKEESLTIHSTQEPDWLKYSFWPGSDSAAEH